MLSNLVRKSIGEGVRMLSDLVSREKSCQSYHTLDI